MNRDYQNVIIHVTHMEVIKAGEQIINYGQQTFTKLLGGT